MCIFCERAQAEAQGLPYLGGDDDEPYPPPQQRTSSTTTSLDEKIEAEKCKANRKRRLPATILTGFLGSGKTTTLNHILRQPHGKALAVIENEFGAVSVDDSLLVDQGGVEDLVTATEVVLMPNGCMCCRVRGDLVQALRALIARQQTSKPLDGILLELSGLADVGPVAQTFFSDPYVQANVVLDSVICVVDARVLSEPSSLKEEGSTSSSGVGPMRVVVEQLCLSDRVLLNKMDLVEGRDKVEGVRSLIRRVNPDAKVLECVKGEVPIDELLGLGSFSLERALLVDHHFEEGIVHGDEGHQHSHLDLGFQSVGVEVVDGPLDWSATKKWLQDLLANQGKDVIFRFKGVLWTSSPGAYRGVVDHHRYVISGVYGHVETEQGQWKATARPCTRIVFIGRLSPSLQQELRAGVLSCLAIHHTKPRQVASLHSGLSTSISTSTTFMAPPSVPVVNSGTTSSSSSLPSQPPSVVAPMSNVGRVKGASRWGGDDILF